MIRFLIGLCLVLAGLPARAQTAPSFDCAKASTEVEKTICASPDLAKADVALSDAYRAALARAPEEAKPLLRSDQRGWLAHLNKICQARYAPPKDIGNYKLECIASALKEQAEFYTEDALTPLPADLGMLVARRHTEIFLSPQPTNWTMYRA